MVEHLHRTNYKAPKKGLPALLLLLGLGLSGLPVFAFSKATDTAWLSFLPKTERDKARSLLEETDRERQSQAEDRDAALAAEATYAGTARILARALDLYTESPSAFSLALSLSGQQNQNLEKAVSALADTRRLRWQTARDLVEKNALRGKLETTIARRDAELSALLKPRIAKVNRKTLSMGAGTLEERLASHETCPCAALTHLDLQL
ncbi:hypothetical protein MASR2M78_05090 [Treponema sp.]